MRRVRGSPGALPARVLAAAIPALLLQASSGAQSPFGAAAYGSPTAGSAGIAPSLSIASQPILGSRTFGLQVSDALGGALTVQLLGFGPATTTLFGAQVHVQFADVVVTTASGAGPGQGEAAVALPLPVDPGLADLALYAQTLVFDQGAAGGLAASEAVRFRLRQNNMLGATAAFQGGQASDAFSAMSHLGGGVLIAGKRSSNAQNRFLRSTDSGTTWQVVGCPRSSGAHTYFFGQNGSTVMSGTGDAGNACVMRSVDLGATWRVVLDAAALRGLLRTSSPRAVFGVVHMGNGHWLANVKTLDSPNSLIQSLDDGATWRLARAQPGQGQGSWARQMIQTSDGVLLWPEVLTDRIYRSTDQGQTWTRATVPTARLFQPLCDAGQGAYLCGEATTSPNTPIRIFRSTDRGLTWVQATEVNLRQPTTTYWRDILAVGQELFASACCIEAQSQSRQMQLFWSPDRGVTWQSLGNPFQGPYGSMQAIYQMCVTDRGEVFAGCQPDSTILKWAAPLRRP
ncbi:MAG: sialidase family protein [Planctomycetota bacterium]|nr:sialidase family protein [Planctomycetota bacterium]